MTRGNIARLVKRVLRVFAVVIAVTLAVGATYESVMQRIALRRYPAPGRLVDIGGRRIQIDCRGAGSPTVVLESGLDNYGSLSWAAVHDSLARTSRVCAYSRAGIMWSDPSRVPFDSRQVAWDLRAALFSAGEHAPWVLVGHSIGGSYISTFTALYPEDVAGLVFVDPAHPDQFARFNAIAGRRMEPNPAIFALGDALAWTGIVRLMPGAVPPSKWPHTMAEAPPAYLPGSVSAMLGEVRAVDKTLEEAGRYRQLDDRPVIVLTATAPKSAEELAANGISAREAAGLQAVSRKLHDSQATWSSRGRHELVSNASHYIQFDRPDVVIRAVRDVIGSVRSLPRAAPVLAADQ